MQYLFHQICTTCKKNYDFIINMCDFHHESLNLLKAINICSMSPKKARTCISTITFKCQVIILLILYDNLSSVSQNVLKFYQKLTGEERRVLFIFGRNNQ
jgi:hypothetical protein